MTKWNLCLYPVLTLVIDIDTFVHQMGDVCVRVRVCVRVCVCVRVRVCVCVCVYVCVSHTWKIKVAIFI